LRPLVQAASPPKSGNRIAQYAVDHRPVVAHESLLQGREPAAHRFERGVGGLRRHDAFDADLGDRLVAGEQEFIEPLARTHAGDFDLDVVPGYEPDSWIIRSASSKMRTGWPMLST
jgi:hypothetical protein